MLSKASLSCPNLYRDALIDSQAWYSNFLMLVSMGKNYYYLITLRKGLTFLSPNIIQIFS